MSKYIYITLGMGFMLGILPTIIIYVVYGHYPTIPVEIADDTVYYLSRVSEVLRGHVFIGNSYYAEHVYDVTTAFFVADWMYAIPFYILSFFGFSFSSSIIFSQIMWTCITSLMLYVLYKKFNVQEKYIPLSVGLSLVTTLLFVYRPVAMSVVFPCFIFFLISLYSYLKNRDGNKEALLLTLSIVICFYVYTYAWQVAFVALGLLFLHALVYRKYIQRVVSMALSTVFLSVPVLVYTWKQIHNIYYFETLERVGLVQTHSVGGAGLAYLVIIVISLVLVFFLYRQKVIEKIHTEFFGLVFLSLCITGLSNVITGKDLEIAVHIGRFTELFVVVFFVFVLSRLSNLSHTIRGISLILLILLTGYVGYLVHWNYQAIHNTFQIVDSSQKYELVTSFLRQSQLKEVTVFADDTVSSYIPPLTEHYVAFHPNGMLYLIGNTEAEERYLVSRMFSNIDKQQLKTDFRKYAGVGNAVHRANVHNRNRSVCSVFKKLVSNIDCGESVTPYSLRGEKYFDDLMERYSYIIKNKEKFLNMYNVDIIVVDAKSNNWDISKLKGFEKKEKIGQFIIMEKVLMSR